MRSRYNPRMYASLYPSNNVWPPAAIFRKLGVYIMPPEAISTAYFINTSP
jgi:hypothetical protein